MVLELQDHGIVENSRYHVWMKAEVFVNTVVEGTTDLGYWNTSLSRVDRLYLGSD